MKALLKYQYIWVPLLIIAIIIVFIIVMPKPIDMDLSKIGDGRKAVVFVYDPNLSVSGQQSVEMNQARSLVGDDVIFLIAKIGDPSGDLFMRRYNSRVTDLLFFNANGDLIDREAALLTAQELAGILSSI